MLLFKSIFGGERAIRPACAGRPANAGRTLKSPLTKNCIDMAERGGFEPPVHLWGHTHDFQSCSLSHSDISPVISLCLIFNHWNATCYFLNLYLAERGGFEPPWELVTPKSISSRSRYDHFGTSPLILSGFLWFASWYLFFRHLFSNILHVW